MVYQIIKYCCCFFVFALCLSCGNNTNITKTIEYVGDSVKKIVIINNALPYLKEIQEYGKNGKDYIIYHTCNDTIDGKEVLYKADRGIRYENIYKMGIQHGITRYAVDNKPISHEGLVINDTIILSKYSTAIYYDSIDGGIENYGYDIFDVKDGNQINSKVKLGIYILKGKKYIDIFHLKNSDIDWSKSSWFCDDLKDTIQINTTEYFTLSSKYYHLPDSVRYLQTFFVLGPIDTKRELIRVNDEFKSAKGDKEIKCHVRIAEKGYQLLTGKIVVHCIGEASKDTLLISNLFYKQVYVE